MTLALPYSAPSPFDDGLRWYQREAAMAAKEALEGGARSVLEVLATGLGKTQIFSAVAGEWRGRILVLCHREELVEQARRRLEQMTGEWVQREQGMFFAELTTRIVVASIDTIRRPKRLERFPRDHFSLIIIDEAHHYVGNTYVRPLEYFASAKALGVTATPDRRDEKALGQVFDLVAYQMDILAGIEHGYLVPIEGRYVSLDEIDISGVGKTGQDLAQGALDDAMLRAVEGIVRETMRIAPERQGIAFFPGVKSAEYAAEKWNALKPGSARFLSGHTPPAERHEIVRAFRRGDFQLLANCMVATEGFDVPEVDLIILGRPTLSRALYTQMVGRGTRTLAGLVDRYAFKDADALRREAVRTSKKPNMLLLDFVGNCGKHELVTLEDVLGGRFTDAEVKTARKKRKEAGGGDPQQALEAARAELKALAAAVEAKVKSTVQAFDPFKAFGVEQMQLPLKGKPVNKSTKRYLLDAGIPPEQVDDLRQAGAEKLMETVKRRRIQGLATFKQLRELKKWGLGSPSMSFYKAKAALDYIASTGWGRKAYVDPQVLDHLVHAREPGMEG